jgi:26S proteasome regulatory subunit N13
MNDAASALVQNLLNSISTGGAASTRQAVRQENIFTTLSDLLTPETCVPVIQSASPTVLDALLSNLPPAIILLETRSDDLAGSEPTPAAAEEALKTLSEGQKKALLIRVIHSPQLHQSLGSLTVALRDGGLPSVAGALNIDVENEGFIRGGAMPLGGGDAVEAFLRGVERTVKKEEDKEKGEGDQMDTS